MASGRGRAVSTACRSLTWRETNFPTTRNSWWRRYCTTSARQSIRADHVAAGLEALNGHITERTGWLIENHMLGHAHYDGTLGARVRQRLSRNESFEELLLLAKCDREGRQKGVVTPELEEAIDYLRELAKTCGE